jgi:hypothetical protein
MPRKPVVLTLETLSSGTAWQRHAREATITAADTIG